MKEIWKQVRGYKGLYKVSNLGRVKSLGGKLQGWRGIEKNDKILKGVVEYYGYRNVSLCKKGVIKTKKVHRLVMEAFVPNKDKTKQINHKDGNKLNNRLTNLEWCTFKENIQHAFKNGFYKKKVGVENNGSKLNEFVVKMIRQLKKCGIKQNSIAELYNISPNVVSKIVRYKTYYNL